MTEREMKLLLDARAIKQVQVHYAVMSQGYMIVADGKPLETGKRETGNAGIQDAGRCRQAAIQAGRGGFRGEVADDGLTLVRIARKPPMEAMMRYRKCKEGLIHGQGNTAPKIGTFTPLAAYVVKRYPTLRLIWKNPGHEKLP